MTLSFIFIRRHVFVLIPLLVLILSVARAQDETDPVDPVAIGGDRRGGEGLDGSVLPKEPDELVEADRRFYADLKRALEKFPNAVAQFKRRHGLNEKAFAVLQRKFGFEAAAADEGDPLGPEMVSLADTFYLHSNPTSTKTIYLDFDGFSATGTFWNNSYGTPINSPAYDPDGNGATFTTNELERIQRIWHRVAEDYAPFDVNVTTEDPGEAALVKTGGGDTEWGIRVVVTVDNFAGCGCGGFAYVDSFNWNYQSSGASDTPAYVFNSSEIGVSAAVSHEAGHSLGLSHDGTTSANPVQPNVTYYDGHGSGETGWGSIMGSGYYSNVTTWDLGEFYGANNGGSGANYGEGPDDLAVISTLNGFGFRPDDHGENISSASPVNDFGVNAGNPNLIDVGQFGIVGVRGDVDFIWFETGSGLVNLTINSYVGRVFTPNGDGSYSSTLEDTNYGTSWQYNQGSNLDVSATLYDSSGTLVATSNPTGLSASFSNLNLAAGTYFISVDGTGFGNPFSSSSTVGYTDYASVGQYYLTGTVAALGLTLSAVATDADKDEGNSGTTPFTFDITISEAQGDPVTVDWAVTGSGAIPADTADFGGSFPGGQVTFPVGVTNVEIIVDVTGDLDLEGDETFLVVLSNPSASEVLAAASGIIRGDDQPEEVVLFYDSFEVAEWNGLWVEDRQNDWFRSTQRATDGARSAEVDGRATNATLTQADAVDVSGFGSATLSFDWLIERRFDNNEFLALDISQDGGSSWTQDVRRLDGNVSQENTWISETVDLTGLGSNVLVRFRSSVSGRNEDANVDNVLIMGVSSGPVNGPPIATDDSYGAAEDEVLNVAAPGGVLSDDSDPEGDSLAAILVSDVTHGSLTLQADGSFVYTPTANYNGPDGFSYKANDGANDSNVATVTLTVSAVNDAPVPDDQFVTVKQDTTEAIFLSASDIDGDPLSFEIVASPGHGALTGAAPNLTYTPDTGHTGEDSFTFKANDGAIDSNVATVTISVSPNNPPTAVPQSPSVNEDTSLNIVLTGSDDDGDALTFFITVNPSHGSLTGTAPNLNYTPSSNYHGTDSLSFRVSDGTADSSEALVSINVMAINDAPLANDQSLNVDEDDSLSITLTGSDIEGSELTYVIVSQPANGSLSGSGENWIYSPNDNYNGDDGFTFRVNDGSLDSAAATIAISVAPVNDAPVASESFTVVNQDTSADITLVADDVDGDGLTYTTVTNPQSGTLSGSGANRSYSPATGYVGEDSFTFKANDGAIDSNVATVTITVTAQPSMEELFRDSFEVAEWNGLWVEDRQNDWFRSTQRATDGARSAEVDGRATNATLTQADAVDVSGFGSATLSFDWLIERRFDNNEFLALDISQDGGSSWTQDVRRLDGNVSQENTWISETVDLTGLGSNVLVRFRSSVSGRNEDANVDNVLIVGENAAAPTVLALMANTMDSRSPVQEALILDIALESSAAVSIGFASKEGIWYSLQRSFDLSTWESIGTPVLGSGESDLATDPSGKSNRAAYYRILESGEASVRDKDATLD